MDLSEFLLARIAEDEEAAREVAKASPGAWAALPVGLLGLSRHMSHVNFLAECDAKRRIVDSASYWIKRTQSRRPDITPTQRMTIESRARAAEETLRLLALPFADHPDYDPAWRP